MSRPLEDVQDELIARLHQGEAFDREAVLAQHPEHREQLSRFLDLLTHLEAPPPIDALRPASLGEFRLVREIGRGGMGIVYEAEQKSLKRRVALKVLPSELLGSPRIMARFRREAEAAGRLRHPGIVPVYSVGEARGVPFFSMELVEGRSLADVLRARAAGDHAGLPPPGPEWQRWVLGMAAKVADALHYAHGQDILHRDVKPGNVLLEADGTPRLTDFGLALDLGSPGLTSPGESCGTPLYMSPEQALRREVPLDPRTDVYSLGVTLYEALTLQTPYRGLSAAEVFAALRAGAIVRPREVDPTIPAELERVVLKALARDVAQRFPSAAALASDLRALLEGRTVPPPPAAPASSGARALRRRALAGALAVGGLALGGWLLLSDRGAGEAPAPTTASASVRSQATPWPLETPPGGPAWARVSKRQIEEAARLKVPVAFENSIGMRFVLIPAGTFLMGSPPDEAGRQPVEAQHEVTLSKPYYLQTTEVTWAQWRRKFHGASTGPVNGQPAGGDRQPVMRIFPAQRDEFIGWLGAQEPGRTYRLPTEAEWEHACRAGTTTPWYWGSDAAQAVEHANLADGSLRRKQAEFDGLDLDDGWLTEGPVASYPPNPWGLHDMIGNVSEWTQDTFAPFGAGPQQDPLVRGFAKVALRGGAWWNPPARLRCAQRAECMPDAFQDLGLRLAVEVPGVTAAPQPPPALSEVQLAEAKRLGVPAWFENALGMRFVLIPAGKFTMGSPAHEPGRLDDEVQHEVTLTRAFYLQTTEATWAQWRRWDPAASGAAYLDMVTDTDEQPVGYVNGASRLPRFLAWVGTQDATHAYRLPTEAEWEYACRAGTTSRWFWGDDVQATARFANVLGRLGLAKYAGWTGGFPLDGLAHPQALPVGLSHPNPWGLHDMLGNVAEWAECTYGPLSSAPSVDPVARGPGRERMARGGAFLNPSTLVRSASRGHATWDPSPYPDIGFRLVAELPVPASAAQAAASAPTTPWLLETPKEGPAWARVSKRQLEEAARLKVPVAFENPIGMRFVLVPAGSFVMGSPPDEAGREWNETQHAVTLSRPYYLQTTEVTWGQWRRLYPDATTGPLDGQPADAAEQPLMRVDPGRIDPYLEWLGAQDAGHRYRLPTEAEWEHACRAGTTTPYYWGSDPNAAVRHANTADAALRRVHPELVALDQDDGMHVTAPVAHYAPSPWGLFDMLGNVGEWTLDGYAPYGPAPQSDPLVRGSARRVSRGSAWWNAPVAQRCAQRSWPALAAYNDIGLRVLVEVPGVTAAPTPPPSLSEAQLAEAKRLGVPAWFENTVGMRFVLIPAGRFSMGSPSHEPGRAEDEVQHEVTISRAFYLQTTETSWAQWRRWDPAAGGTVWEGTPTDADDQPVSAVNGESRLAGFVAWLGTQDPKHAYRLPTEAEWEYACRAGTTARWFWGEHLPAVARHANVLGRLALAKHPSLPGAYPIDGLLEPGPMPVGSYLPNAWGLHDMLGNIAEWAADGYGSLDAAPATDPLLRGQASERMARGGAWQNPSNVSRCACRGHAAWDSGRTWVDIGFRLACDLTSAPAPAGAPGANDPKTTPWPLETPEDGPAWARVSKRQLEEAERLKVPVAFENSIGMRFVLIPAGEFTMGSPLSEPWREAYETQHRVTLTKPYYLATTELTAGQLRAWIPVYQAGRHQGRDEWNDDQHPATMLREADVPGLLAWLGERDPGRRYRLPTEAEWEHACRAGTTTRWYWGDDVRDGARYANMADRRLLELDPKAGILDVDDGAAGPAHVGRYLPNPWGLFDMAGNAIEWCADDFAPHAAEPATDPLVRRGGAGRVIRGGGFGKGWADGRSAARWASNPAHVLFIDTTIRVACDVPVR